LFPVLRWGLDVVKQWKPRTNFDDATPSFQMHHAYSSNSKSSSADDSGDYTLDSSCVNIDDSEFETESLVEFNSPQNAQLFNKSISIELANYSESINHYEENDIMRDIKLLFLKTEGGDSQIDEEDHHALNYIRFLWNN
jgi:hypothetical protein